MVINEKRKSTTNTRTYVQETFSHPQDVSGGGLDGDTGFSDEETVTVSDTPVSRYTLQTLFCKDEVDVDFLNSNMSDKH